MHHSLTHTHTHTHTHTDAAVRCMPGTDQGGVQADTQTSLMIYFMRMRRADRFCSLKHSYSFLLDQNTDAAEGLMVIHVNIKRGQRITRLHYIFRCDCWKNKKRLPVLTKRRNKRDLWELLRVLFAIPVSYGTTALVRKPEAQIIFRSLGTECHFAQEAK